MSQPPDEAPAARRRGRPGFDQATVLRTAIDLFNKQGYDRTTVGDVANALGLSKSAIYHHVSSKEHLLAAALDEALDGLTAAVEKALDAGPGTTAAQRLRTAVHESVELLVDSLPAVTLLLRVRGNSDLELDALKRRRQLDDQLATLVRAAVDEGAVRRDLPPELISRLLFGLVNSLVEWYQPDGPVDRALLADAVTSMAFSGLDSPLTP